MFLIFDIVFLLYSVLYFPYLILAGRWHRGFFGRFGFFAKNLEVKLGKSSNVWIHAVSVGEIIAVEGFIRALKLQRPELQIVCSVTTKTGYELARVRFANLAIVIPSPLDFSLTAHIFVETIKPRLYIAAETEIWPNLFARLHQKGVPIAIINGRISDRSYGRYLKIKWLLKPVLNRVSVFAMQSQEDVTRIINLGAPFDRVKNTGNIKFDDLPLGNPIVTLDYPVWIAGSTHPGEEKIVLDVYRRLKPQFSQWQLVLAPRHIERSSAIAALVKGQGFSFRLLSELHKGMGNPNEVIIVDTMGRLKELYAQASLVFVGKSLCVGGGHNIIEPACFSKAVIVGPMMANFKDVLACFKSEEAVLQVKDADELERVVKDLMGSEKHRKVLGERARAVIDRNQGATQRTLTLIQSCL